MHFTPSYLRKIQKTFYFRIAYPKPVAHKLDSREFLKSLRTQDLRLAKRLAADLARIFLAVFESGLHEAMNDRYLRDYLKQRFERVLNSYKLCMINYPGYDLSGLDKVFEQGYAGIQELPDGQLLDEAERNGLEIKDDFDLQVFRKAVAKVSKEGLLVAAEFSRKLARFEVDEEAEKARILASDNYLHFPEELLKLQAQNLWLYQEVEEKKVVRDTQRRLERFMETGGFKEPDEAPLPSENAVKNSSDSALPKSSSTSLSALIESFFEIKANSLETRSIAAYKGIFQRLDYFLGSDFDLKAFSYETARQFESFLLKLPSNINKNRELQDAGRVELERYLELNPSIPRLGDQTVKNYITKLSSLFSFGKSRGFVRENYFEGWAIQRRTSREDAEKRKRFTDAEVLSLLPTSQEQQSFSNDYQKHIIHIGAFTGMRLEEICSLYIGNIEEIDGVLCFNLTGKFPKQRYKNQNARRIVPLHQELFRSGFVDFWKGRKRRNAPTDQLFLDCTYVKEQFSKNASRWFNSSYKGERGWKGFKGVYDTPQTKLNFHSFRHTFVSKMLEQEGAAALHIIQFIVGHGQEGVTTRIYGSNASRSVADMQRLVNKISYSS